MAEHHDNGRAAVPVDYGHTSHERDTGFWLARKPTNEFIQGAEK